MFHLKHLHNFIVVAETEHVGRAAERLHLTQPPLSRQMALLEEDLGVSLFVRHPKGVSLTSAGQQFYDDAKRILNHVEQARHNARQVAAGKQGKLSIGFMMHAAYNIVPSLAKAFMSSNPLVSLKLQEVIPSELATTIQQGQLDGAITLKTPLPNGVNSVHLCSEKLCLAIPKGHELESRTSITADMLAACGLITVPMDVAPELRRAIDGYCNQAGFQPRIVLETQLQQTIISLVAEDLGIALVPVPVQKLMHENVVFKSITNSPSVDYVFIWRDDNLNPALPAFLKTTRRYSLSEV